MNDINERAKKEEDYYAGYYWGFNSYDSEYLSTEKTDDKLKRKFYKICKEMVYIQMPLRSQYMAHLFFWKEK